MPVWNTRLRILVTVTERSLPLVVCCAHTFYATLRALRTVEFPRAVPLPQFAVSLRSAVPRIHIAVYFYTHFLVLVQSCLAVYGQRHTLDGYALPCLPSPPRTVARIYGSVLVSRVTRTVGYAAWLHVARLPFNVAFGLRAVALRYGSCLPDTLPLRTDCAWLPRTAHYPLHITVLPTLPILVTTPRTRSTPALCGCYRSLPRLPLPPAVTPHGACHFAHHGLRFGCVTPGSLRVWLRLVVPLHDFARIPVTFGGCRFAAVALAHLRCYGLVLPFTVRGLPPLHTVWFHPSQFLRLAGCGFSTPTTHTRFVWIPLPLHTHFTWFRYPFTVGTLPTFTGHPWFRLDCRVYAHSRLQFTLPRYGYIYCGLYVLYCTLIVGIWFAVCCQLRFIYAHHPHTHTPGCGCYLQLPRIWLICCYPTPVYGLVACSLPRTLYVRFRFVHTLRYFPYLRGWLRLRGCLTRDHGYIYTVALHAVALHRVHAVPFTAALRLCGCYAHFVAFTPTRALDVTLNFAVLPPRARSTVPVGYATVWLIAVYVLIGSVILVPRGYVLPLV